MNAEPIEQRQEERLPEGNDPHPATNDRIVAEADSFMKHVRTLFPLDNSHVPGHKPTHGFHG